MKQLKKTDCIEDELCEAAVDVEAILEDNSFAYEYGSERGIHNPGDTVRVERGVTLELDVTDANDDNLPITHTGSFSKGGCDGEHRGRCRKACAEYEVEWEANLQSARREKGRLIAVYEIGGKE